MRTSNVERIGMSRWLPALLLTAIAMVANADVFTYTTNSPDTNTITITGYTGSGGAVTIPETINGLSVTSIGGYAFYRCTGMTSVNIPESVTNIRNRAFAGCGLTSIIIPNSVNEIGESAFNGCTNLTNATIGRSVNSIGNWAFGADPQLAAIMVDPLNSVYSSVDGVLYNKSQTTIIICPWARTGSFTIPDNVTSIGFEAFAGCTRLTNITIPNSVTSIGFSAFQACISLTRVTIPNSVTSIGGSAFGNCDNLTEVYFRGNAPDGADGAVFNSATLYYLPGALGWSTNCYYPTALWRPKMSENGRFDVQSDQFGFNVNWASGMVVVVEANTNLPDSLWSPLLTNTLTADTYYFSDRAWTNYPARFYRVRWQ